MVGFWKAGGGSWRRAATIAAAGLTLAACATSRAPSSGPLGVNGTMRPYEVHGVHYVPHAQPGYDKVGLASWYGQESPNRTTADGERFDGNVASAAHTTLPLPCLVEVTNLDNGRRIEVRVNDRGPFARGRILDLSRQGAKDLGFYGQGMAHVRVRYIGPAPLTGGGAVLARAKVAPEPTPVQTTEPVPVITAATPAPGVVRVQAGAFAERANAERAAALLSAQGTSSIEPLDRGGAVIYRVLVTGAEGEDPQALRQRVAAAGFPGAKVTSAF